MATGEQSPARQEDTSAAARFRLAVGIPTRKRPAILPETLKDLSRQTRQPDAVFVAYFEPSDVGNAPELFPHVRFIQVTGPEGSCAQRNFLLDAAGDAFDLILITDDDCYLQRHYIERTEQVFAADPTVVGTTGNILKNGATGPGYSVAFAQDLLRGIPEVPTLGEQPPVPTFNTDGCNMAFRMEVLRGHHIRFDENMPGYAWYEDIDFSRRFLPYGRLVLVPCAQAVHLGAKVGKTPGVRSGYSQVANPVFIARKKLVPWSFAWERLLKNFAANLVRSLKPEPYADRRGRLRGNLLAFRDWVQGRLQPDRILGLR